MRIRPIDRLPARLLVPCLVALLGGCYAHRAVAPLSPAAQPARASAEQVALYLRTFAIAGASSRDRREQIEHLQDVLLDYLESRTRFRFVSFDLSGERALEPGALELHVRIHLDQETHRTYLYDALNVFPCFGALPIVPWWGDAQVDLEVSLSRPGASAFVTYHHIVRAPFSAMAYAWYRRGYVERAYRRAYDEAFRRVAEQIAVDAGRITAVALASPDEADSAGVRPFADSAPREHGDAEPSPAGSPAATAPSLSPSTSDARGPRVEKIGGVFVVTPESSAAEQGVVELPPDGFHVITREEAPRLDGTWYGYLRLLGGLEVSGFYGFAHVSSQGTDRQGRRIEVARGDASQSGYRVALYSAPRTTGFFVYPVLGFLSQRISNVDARSELSSFVPDDPYWISAVAADPETGELIDPGTADVYDLHMKSGYGGLRAGYDVVGGNDTVVFFVSLSLGVNVAEYRSITARLVECGRDTAPEACRARHEGWDFVESGAAGGTLGLEWPKAHLAVRLIADYELYRRFAYGKSLAVRGPLEDVPDKPVPEHPILYMEGASLGVWSLQLATAVVF